MMIAMLKVAPFMTLLVLFVLVHPSRADLYRYTDKNGVVHITNLPKRQYRRFIKSSMILGPGSKETKRRRQTREFNPNGRSGAWKPKHHLRDTTSKDKFQRYDTIIRDAALKYQIPIPFIKAVIKVESGYHPGAVSVAGASGLMQLMPGTARALGVRKIFDPRENIFGGVKYLRILANRFNGDLTLVLSGYHAGEGAVMRKGGIPFEKTDQYVKMVLAWYYRYKTQMPSQ